VQLAFSSARQQSVHLRTLSIPPCIVVFLCVVALTLLTPLLPTLQATSRLAVVDLDWANITATDILAVMRSFDPHGGKGEAAEDEHTGCCCCCCLHVLV
jgi:hypothetical protein